MSQGFPVITLEVEGMKIAVKKALAEYLTDLSSEVASAVDRVCTPENVQRVTDAEAARVLDLVVREEVERYYRHGPGLAAVRRVIEEKLRSPVIGIPSQPFTAQCPQCGMKRFLPDGWQEIMRGSMPLGEAGAWDGVLRCRNGHDPLAMTISETS